MTNKEETRAVKQALQEARIPFIKIHHGAGTSKYWLHIKVVNGEDIQDAILIVQSVTGRQGKYDGNIIVGSKL